MIDANLDYEQKSLGSIHEYFNPCHRALLQYSSWSKLWENVSCSNKREKKCAIQFIILICLIFIFINFINNHGEKHKILKKRLAATGWLQSYFLNILGVKEIWPNKCLIYFQSFYFYLCNNFFLLLFSLTTKVKYAKFYKR